jgi:hypothetical protein
MKTDLPYFYFEKKLKLAITIRQKDVYKGKYSPQQFTKNPRNTNFYIPESKVTPPDPPDWKKLGGSKSPEGSWRKGSISQELNCLKV